MRGNRLLAVGLGLLGSGIAACALLGPLGLDVLRYRTSELARNQIVGGDAAALVTTVPLCLAAAVLAWRGRPAAPVLALPPAVFALYTYTQLVMGNEYLDAPGNVERFFPLLLAVVVLAGAVTVRAWHALADTALPTTSRRFDRTVGWLLLAIAAFVVLGLHAASYLDAVADTPTDPQYLGAPTAFWAVKLWDLALVAPTAVAVGVGVLRGRAWARAPMYAVLGGFALLGCSVAGMAWRMALSGDPGGSAGSAVVVTALATAGLLAAWRLYRPLLRAEPRGAVPADVAELAAVRPVVERVDA